MFNRPSSFHVKVMFEHRQVVLFLFVSNKSRERADEVKGRYIFHPSSANIIIWICFQNEEK